MGGPVFQGSGWGGPGGGGLGRLVGAENATIQESKCKGQLVFAKLGLGQSSSGQTCFWPNLVLAWSKFFWPNLVWPKLATAK